MNSLKLRDIMTPEDMKYIRYVTDEPHWQDYDDGSGYFVGVTGEGYFSYDLSTDEIMVNGRWRTPISEEYLDGGDWKSYYAKRYCADLIHDDLIEKAREESGIESAVNNHDVRLSDVNAVTVAIGDGYGISAEIFKGLLNICQKLENQNFSDSTLHCDELAKMMVKAIHNAPEGAEYYRFEYEGTELSFAAISCSVLDDATVDFSFANQSLEAFWDAYDRIREENRSLSVSECISMAVDDCRISKENPQFDEEEL